MITYCAASRFPAYTGVLVSVFIVGVAFAGTITAEEQAGTAWEVRVGPASHRGLRITSTWQPDAVQARLAPFFGRRSDPRPNVGPVRGYADRDYTDGFVYMDMGTDDPETDIPGLTWFWGYENAAQYSGDSVLFHSAPFTDSQTRGLPMAADETAERFNLTGVDASVSGRLWDNGSVAVGVNAGFAAYQSRSLEHAVQRVAARETAITQRVVDTYAAEHEPFPAAPYANTLEGPGYLLRNEPDSRRLETLASSRRDWIATAQHEVDVQVLDVRLGPSLWWTPHERLGLRLTPHARLAHVDLEATAHTRIAPTRRGPIEFSTQNRRRQWVLGYGAEAAATLTLYKGWLLGISAAADWWEKDVDVTADPFNSVVELGQWTFTASVGKAF